MKQSLSRARTNRYLSLVVVVTLTSLSCSCVRQSRRLPSASELTSASNAANEKRTAERLNINTAAAPELEKLPGVGKILAERIVSHRRQYGPFRRAEHLMMVHGFSDHKFRAIRELITVE